MYKNSKDEDEASLKTISKLSEEIRILVKGNNKLDYLNFTISIL